jgi:hypothetical protein
MGFDAHRSTTGINVKPQKSVRGDEFCVSSGDGSVMHPDDPNLDQRLSRFEAQLDRFSLALQQWQQQTRLSPPAALSANVDQRIRTLEETLDREAVALRRLHEEPLKELQAHAAALKEICAAASRSVNGLDQAESRLAAMQADVHTHLTDLSRTLQALVADLRGGGSTALATHRSAAAWPLERIVDLHDELRRTASDREPGATSASDSTPTGDVHPAADPGATGGPGDRPVRGQLLEATIHVDHGGSPATVRSLLGFGRGPWVLGGALIAAAALVFVVERQLEKRLNEATDRVAAAERQAMTATQLANKEVVVARQEANRQIAEARESAQRAEIVGAILTAPDLIRFTLTSTSVDRSSAQLLWSRTRGLVLSASRLPAAPPDTMYQLWLKTSAEPVSAGVFVPDAIGRATLVTDAPPKIVGPVVGAEVTVEPSGGGSVPSGRALLVRYPPG